jgi:O-antigen/teichoic acid export membrane protein
LREAYRRDKGNWAEDSERWWRSRVSEASYLSGPDSRRASARRIVGNSVAGFVYQIAGQFILFGQSLVLARYLGKEGYGLLTFAFTFVAFFEIPAVMGTNVVINREMAILRGQSAATFWRSALALRTGLFLMAMLAAVGGAALVARGDLATLAVMGWACAGLVTSIRAAYMALLRAHEKVGLSALIVLGRTIAYTVLVVAIVAARGSLVSIVQASLIATLAALWVEQRCARPLVPGGGHVDPRVVRGILSAAWPLALSAVLTIAQLRVDVLILKVLGGDAAVGLYAVALKPVEAAFIISSALSAAAFPALSRAFAGDRPHFAVLCQELLLFLLLAGLPVIAILSPLGTAMIPQLFGGQYGESGRVFAVLCLHVPLGFVNVLLVNMLFAARLQKLEMWASVATTAANVVTNVLLIPVWGALGAAVAALVCQIVALAFLGIVVAKRAPFRIPWRRALSIVLLAGLALACVLALRGRLHWALVGALVGGGYLAAGLFLTYDRGRALLALLNGTES